MPKTTVYNLNKDSVGEIDLADEVFGAKVNEDLFYEVIKAQLASRRRGTAAVKNRALRQGSSKKVYRQKGTGNARHGSIRAPIYVGGGRAHGPKPRSYAYRPPRKMRLGALRSALSMKLQEGRLLVVDDFEVSEIKTKAVAKVLGTLAADSTTVIIDQATNEKLRLSVRNLASHQFLPPEGLNLYDLLRHDQVIVTRKAVEALEQRCSTKKA